MSELIAILASKDNYYKFKPLIKDHTIPKETRIILNDFDEYYTNNPSVTAIDMGKFSTWFLVLKHSSFKKSQVEIYTEIFNNVSTILKAPTSPTAEDIIELFIERDYATRLADHSLKIASGDDKASITECEDIIDEYHSISKRVKKNSTLESSTFAELFAPSTDGLDWRLNALNKSLGPLRMGDFVVVGKLPESGGTAFVISEMTNMLEQIEDDEEILYFGNEERSKAIRKRVISSVLNRNGSYVEANPIPCATNFLKAKGDRIRIHAVHGMNMQSIERIIKASDKPRLIIIDQLWKVPSYGKGTNDVTRITNLFVKARELASKYAPVMAVHQADGSAYGTVYVGMEQLYMSRIGIQGEADAIITLGISDEVGKDKTRYINIPKNKLEGGAMSMEVHRHSRWEVKIIPEVSRYID